MILHPGSKAGPSRRDFWRSLYLQAASFAGLRITLASIGLVAVFGLCHVAIEAAVLKGLPELSTLENEIPPAIKYLDRHGVILYETASEGVRNDPVPLDRFAPSLVQATISTEDADFYHHRGYDLKALVRAVVSSVSGSPSGGSTITQQLARNFGLDDAERRSRTVKRKIREIVLAARMEIRFSKSDILTAYLNSAPYGARLVGAESASRFYFGKPAAALDLAEAAMLAGLPRSPVDLDPTNNPSGSKSRQAIVLKRLVATGHLSAGDAASALEERLTFAGVPEPIEAPHFVLSAHGQSLQTAIDMEARFVYTTLESGLQLLAEDTLTRHVRRLADHQVTDAALVAIDPKSGEILALAGSVDYFNQEIDGAVNVAISLRQPGSAIKPLTYAAAFERGMSPGTVVPDVRTVFRTRDGSPFEPVNYDHRFHGPLSLRVSLASSINVVAVGVLERIGIGALLDFGSRVGISSWANADRYDLALTLGGGEVSLLELTSAYAAFASGGEYRAPRYLRAMEDAANRVVWKSPRPGAVRAMSPETAFLVNYVLSDPAARELGFGFDSALELGRTAAVKTGTTAAFRDNWTIGYTPDLVVGVWVGNAGGQPMSNVTGVTGAAPIWRDFMESALRDSPNREFSVPDGIVWKDVCAVDGLLLTPECPTPSLEPFVAGNEPTGYSTSFQRASGRDDPIWIGCSASTSTIRWYPPFEVWSWANESGLRNPSTGSCTAGQVASPSAAIEIVSPIGGETFQFSKRLPINSQRIELSIVSRSERTDVTIDGDPLILDRNGQAFVPMTAGMHSLRAIARNGRGEIVAETTREYVVLE